MRSISRRGWPSLFGLLLAFGLGSALARAETVVPKFQDVTAQAGITTVYKGDWQYMVGGGVAAFDCNADGLDDVFVAGGEGRSALYRNVSQLGGDIRFAVTDGGLELDAVTGAYPIDIDSDAMTDLVVLRVGENLIMRGLGDCRFERANESWGFDGGDGWSTAFAATWEKGNDWPTLAIGNYIDRKQEMEPWGSCTDNWLHRPATGQKGFAKPVALKPSYCALGMLFSDWNRSGTPSLRITNDREYYEGGQEQMWRVEPGAEPRLYGPKDGWQELRVWGMGIAGYDLDSDGYPEYALTSMADNKLQALADPKDGKPVYKDVAFARGVTAHRPYQGADLKPSTAWHVQFEDVNNDGLADLFIAKGNVDEMPDFAMTDPNNLLLQQADGTFLEAGGSSGISNNGKSRGAIWADFNLDGLLDLVVVNRRTSAQVWQNVMVQPGSFVQIALKQTGSNRDAIGSWIEVKRGSAVARREITAGGGHVSGYSGWWHFGLGSAQTADVRVIWPDGTTSPWHKVKGETRYVLERGKPPEPWQPR